jgi:hypothetical protein
LRTVLRKRESEVNIKLLVRKQEGIIRKGKEEKVMSGKKLLVLTSAVLLVFATAVAAWAACPQSFSRPIQINGQGPGTPMPTPMGFFGMDYVPQQIGIYDTVYHPGYTEQGGEGHSCRKCHGNSLADRHHMSQRNLCPSCYPPPYETCTYCHPVGTDLNNNGIWEPTDYYPKGDWTEYPEGVRMPTNCTAVWCHEPAFLDPPPDGHGWHHNTDMAASENCIACHDPKIIEEITPFRNHQAHPPVLDYEVIPTPFDCENCHWKQPIDADNHVIDTTEDACDPGHPSTYEFPVRDLANNFVPAEAFHEYDKDIFDNKRTHHMMELGDIYPNCEKCHSQDPNEPGWTYDNPENIRYCEICHTAGKLHYIMPHVQPHAGWVPAGFHTASEDPTNPCQDISPTQYRTGDDGTGTIVRRDANGFLYVDADADGVNDLPWPPNPTWGLVPDGCQPDVDKWQRPGDGSYGPAGLPNNFTVNEQCEGCHADSAALWDPEIPDCPPWIDPEVDGIQPKYASCGAVVTLRGGCFGEEHTIDRWIEVRQRSGGGWAPGSTWITLPIHGWTDTMIEFEAACYALVAGNYRVRVVTEVGTSNQAAFVLNESPNLAAISPAQGPCGTQVTLSGAGGFGNNQSQLFADSYHGVHHAVHFWSLGGEYTVTQNSIVSWSDTSVVMRIWDFFEDGIDPCAQDWWGTGIPLPNYIQDQDGITAPCDCPDETTIKRCECASLGVWSVYVKSIYYGDEDTSGDLSCGDTIFEIEKSDPVYFEFTGEPFINKVNPRRVTVRVCKDPAGPDPLDYYKMYPRIKLYGVDFGDNPGEIYVGTLGNYNTWTDAIPGNEKGRKQNRIKMWEHTLIKFALVYNCKWEGKRRYVWVVNSSGEVSNPMRFKILGPTQGACAAPPVIPCP